MQYKHTSSGKQVKKTLETRARRSYSCGPCKRYKTRCNLEIPCHSCVAAKRPDECLHQPPNPPSEDEKIRIEKRRNKSSQRLAHSSNRTSKPRRNLVPSRRNSQEHTVRSDADGTRPELVSASGTDLFFPAAPDTIYPLPIRVPHLKDFAFVRKSYCEWARQTIEIPLPMFLRCKEVAGFLTYPQLLKYFLRFSIWDTDGFQYLVDTQLCFSVATNFILKVPQEGDDLDSRTFNSLLVRVLNVVFVIIALGRLLDGESQTARVFLELSVDLLTLLGPPTSLGDFVHVAVVVLLNKMPSVLLGDPLRLVKMFEQLTKMMSGSSEVLRYLTMTDPQQREGNEEFIAFARVWVLARFAEPEIGVLSAGGSLQVSLIEPRKSILPDPALCTQLFNTTLDVLSPESNLFDLVILLSSRHFPRFAAVSDVRELILSYLMLYLEMGTAIAPLTAKMYLELQESTTTIAGVAKYTEALLLAILVNFFATRWLRLTKIEKPYFPSLRFAHYVSSLMCTFNWIEELDFRLFDGNGTIYAFVFDRSKNFSFLQIYLQLTYQAIFLVVFAQFRSPLSHLLTIDLDYIFRCVYASMTTVFQKVRHLKPFCLIPAVANILAVVEALEEFALSTPILADDSMELIEALQMYVEPLLWEAMTLMLFGSESTCSSYIEQLWHLAMEVQSNGTAELFITQDVKLDTDFFRNFATSFEPFRFTTDLAEQYMRDIVDPGMELQQETSASDTM